MFLLYADLQPEGLAALDAAPTEEAARVILSELLGLPLGDLRQEVLLELYMNALTFARSKGFSVEKTSTFVSIIKRNHEEMAEAFLPPGRSWEYLKVRAGLDAFSRKRLLLLQRPFSSPSEIPF